MSIEVLKILGRRDNYVRYNKFISDHTVSQPEIKIIVKGLDEYYKKHQDKEEIDWDSFATWFILKNVTLPKDKLNLFNTIFDRVKVLKDDDSLAMEIIHTFILRDYGGKIGDAAYKAEDGKTDNLDSVYDLLKEYMAEVDHLSDHEKYIIKHDIVDLVDDISKGGFEWRLKCLNNSLGPLRKGDFIVFATRPDGGKTSMLASETTFMAPQLPEDQVVLWFNNESEGKKVKWRCLQTAINKTTEQINYDPVKAKQEYITALGGNPDKILIFDRPFLTTGFVEDMLRRYSTGLIIVDQLYKVHGFDKVTANEVGRQGMLFQWARELAKEYAPLLTVHQLDGQAEGLQWVGYDRLYGSKTIIQGEADAIVTLGWPKVPGEENKRYLYVPKNKLTGGPKSIPGERNGKYELTIIPEIGRYIE